MYILAKYINSVGFHWRGFP